MATPLQTFRAQHPEYAKISDRALADALHAKFYSSLPLDRFYDQIGITTKGSLEQADRSNPVGGFMNTLNRAIPGASEVSAALSVPGQFKALGGDQDSLSGAWDAARELQSSSADRYERDHPHLAALGKGFGLAGQIAALLGTDGASAAFQAPRAASVGGRALQFARGTAVNAAKGASAAAINAAAAPGTVQERLSAGAGAAPIGAALGAVLPPTVAGTAAGVRGAMGAAGAIGKTAVRAANAASGGTMADPIRTATQRLIQALKADGATPDLIQSALNGFLKNGATDPSLIDIAGRLPSGGQNTLALVRKAASQGSGRGVAVTYGDQVAGGLQDKADALTRRLTPNLPTSAPELQTAATAARRTMADTEYQAPYAAQVDAAPVVPAIEGRAGANAINSAGLDADAMRLADQQKELATLSRAANGAPQAVSIGGSSVPASPSLLAKIQAALGKEGTPGVPVSLGTLDRIKVALNTEGNKIAADNPARASGLFQRAQEIDDHLASLNPDYASARTNYAQRSAGIDAIEHGGKGLNMPPDQYVQALQDFVAKGGDTAPEGGILPIQGAGVGLRQSLTDAIGRPGEGQSGGLLNRIATGPNVSSNLTNTFGPEATQTYQGGLTDLIDQTGNARFINPNTGSQSAGRLFDEGMVTHIPLSKHGVLMATIRAIQSGAALTDAERKAIAGIATSKATQASLSDLTPDLAEKLRLVPPGMLDGATAYGAGMAVGDQR